MAQILASGAAGSSDLTFAFLVTVLEIIAVIAAVIGVQVILRIYAEETGGRVEPVRSVSSKSSAPVVPSRLGQLRLSQPRTAPAPPPSGLSAA
jgi:putative exporter of polyketide antibiotics